MVKLQTIHVVEIGMLAVAVVLAMAGLLQMLWHLKKHPRIDSAEDLEAFKHLARSLPVCRLYIDEFRPIF